VLPGKRDSDSVGGGLGASAPNLTVGASVLPLDTGFPTQNKGSRHSGSCHGGEQRPGEGDHWGPQNPQGLQDDGNVKNKHG
jgi:hypothetical protein